MPRDTLQRLLLWFPVLFVVLTVGWFVAAPIYSSPYSYEAGVQPLHRQTITSILLAVLPLGIFLRSPTRSTRTIPSGCQRSRQAQRRTVQRNAAREFNRRHHTRRLPDCTITRRFNAPSSSELEKASGSQPATDETRITRIRELKEGLSSGSLWNPTAEERAQIDQVIKALGEGDSMNVQLLKIAMEGKRYLIYNDKFVPPRGGKTTYGLTYPTVFQNIIMLHADNFTGPHFMATGFGGTKFNSWLAETMVHEQFHHNYFLEGKTDMNLATQPGVHHDIEMLWGPVKRHLIKEP